MSNYILEKLIKERSNEYLNKLNSVKITTDIFSRLMDRERDILTRRFGLHGQKNETLEGIGRLHKLTRERVRQIEAASIRKIKQLDDLENYILNLKNTINDLLLDHGGILRKDFLLDILTVIVLEIRDEKDKIKEEEKLDRQAYKNNFDFILSKILVDDFEIINKSDKFNPYIKTKEDKIDHFEELADDLLKNIEASNATLSTQDLLDSLKKLDSYNRNSEKLKSRLNADLFAVYKSKTFYDKAEIIEPNKVLYSLVQAIKNLERNKFGEWGRADWQEVKPKTINDKIYLVLKHVGKSMHFTEIAEKINEVGFDHKKANAATVHNELILDDRYVLVGRGTYALKKWQENK